MHSEKKKFLFFQISMRIYVCALQDYLLERIEKKKIIFSKLKYLWKFNKNIYESSLCVFCFVRVLLELSFFFYFIFCFLFQVVNTRKYKYIFIRA